MCHVIFPLGVFKMLFATIRVVNQCCYGQNTVISALYMNYQNGLPVNLPQLLTLFSGYKYLLCSQDPRQIK